MANELSSWPSPDEVASTDDAPSTDVLFDVLSHEYRRSALTYMLGGSGAVPIDELGDHLAGEIEDDNGAERVTVLLHHAHLPKLNEAGVIDYDREARRAVPTGRLTDIEDTLRTE